MASTQLSDVSAALSLVFRDKLTTQINSVSVLPYLLPVVKGEGKGLFWTAEFSGASNAAAVAEGAAASAADADDEAEVNASLGWAYYRKVASVTGLAQAASGSNFNPESIGAAGRDLLEGRVLRQARRLALGMSSDMYAGNETLSPIELAGAARAIDSSGTFASIDPVTYTEWVAAEDTELTVSVDKSTVREKLLTPVYDACGESPEFMTCDSATYDLMKSIFDANDFHGSAREVVLARGGGARGMDSRVVQFHAGMDVVFIDGIPLVRDRFSTANTIYAWNTNYVEIQQLDPIASRIQAAGGVLEFFRRITGNPHLQLPREQLEGMAARTAGLTPHIRLLGDRGDSSEAMVQVYAQMCWKRRNAFGKLTLT